MIKSILEFFGIFEKTKTSNTVEQLKPVEPAKCGCGRSPTGLCVGLHKLTAEEWAISDQNLNKVVSKPETKAKTVKSNTKVTSKKQNGSK